MRLNEWKIKAVGIVLKRIPDNWIVFDSDIIRIERRYTVDRNEIELLKKIIRAKKVHRRLVPEIFKK